jgi:hypothetical protein
MLGGGPSHIWANPHSWQEIPFAMSQAVSSFQVVIESPSVAATFFDEGYVRLPMNAFGNPLLPSFWISLMNVLPSSWDYCAGRGARAEVNRSRIRSVMFHVER